MCNAIDLMLISSILSTYKIVLGSQSVMNSFLLDVQVKYEIPLEVYFHNQ